ncbi:hypothetical protein MNBD_GAMMA23-218 [hydrothermal vent metagenome]|uniref:SH3b domain-containing protein n=1 Tax=hydrothermal vent metagenome TaxID=652676 RepID=A0A3B1AE47_9ZZZZ
MNIQLKSFSILLTVLISVSSPIQAKETDKQDEYQKVKIVEAYIELHTGPGSGFPIFFVDQRGNKIKILKRKTDWFQVQTDSNKIGWVSREQLEKTLTEAGVKKSFKDILLDDYIKSRLEFGIAAGLFEDEQSFTLRTGYKLTPNIIFELAYTKIAGKFSSSTLYQGNFNLQLYPDSRLSPFLFIGYGKFENVPAASLLAAQTSTLDMANAGIGVKFYLSDQFYFRAEASTYVVLVGDNRSDEYSHFSAGFSFFF